MTLHAETLAQIGTFLVGITTFATAVLGFFKRKSIAIFFRDRRDLKNTIDRLNEGCADAERHARQAKDAVDVQMTTIAAQAETIELLRAEISDLKDIKRRFTALVVWLPQMFEYVAYLERIVTPEQRGGRKMPELPEALMMNRTLFAEEGR